VAAPTILPAGLHPAERRYALLPGVEPYENEYAEILSRVRQVVIAESGWHDVWVVVTAGRRVSEFAQ
jgi:hypothetical protein